MDWSKRVLALRAKRKLSQEKLATAIGVERHTISSWETGKIVPGRLNRAVIEQMEREEAVR